MRTILRGWWRSAAAALRAGGCLLAIGCGGAVSGGGTGGPGGPSTSSTAASFADTSTDACAAVTSFPATSACVALSTPDTLDQALGALGASRCGLSFAPEDLALSIFDPTRQRASADFAALFSQPMSLPGYGAAWKQALAAAAAGTTPLAATLALAATRRGDAIDACTPGWTPADSDPAPLVNALLGIGAAVPDAQAVSGISLDLQRALAPVVRAAAAAAMVVNEVRPEDPTATERLAGIATWMVGVRHFDLTADFVSQLQAIDVARIEAAAVRLSTSIEQAKLGAFAGAPLASFTVATRYGTVILRGAGDDQYGPEADHALLLVDTGGNDVYHAALAASSASQPVSVALDLAGDDHYGYVEVVVPADGTGARLPSDGQGRSDDGRSLSTTFRQGVGALGIGLLFDLGGGSDDYRSLIGSQGVGALGVGALYDDGGSDHYSAEGFAQGAAAFGVGVVLDAAGDDAAVLYTEGQGFGFAGGVGVLLDVSGNDDYLANPGDPSLGGDRLYGSDQLPGAPTTALAGNMSFAQGVGQGHRPDWPDPGFPFPGGTGVLADLAGDDSYRAGVWAQGVGFVGGLGVLLDDSGDDGYDALYYAQGAGAHMGIGLHADGAGEDRYDERFPAVDAMLGLGEDFSLGIHQDLAGDDHYAIGDSSLGVGSANGIGLAVNVGGSDSFSSSDGGTIFGGASPAVDTSRAAIPTYGIFLKVGGPSVYRVHVSGDAWSTIDGAFADQLPPLRGFGEDLPAGEVDFPLP